MCSILSLHPNVSAIKYCLMYTAFAVSFVFVECAYLYCCVHVPLWQNRKYITAECGDGEMLPFIEFESGRGDVRAEGEIVLHRMMMLFHCATNCRKRSIARVQRGSAGMTQNRQLMLSRKQNVATLRCNKMTRQKILFMTIL